MVDRPAPDGIRQTPLLSFEGIGPRGNVLGSVFFEVIEAARKRHWAYSSVGLEHTPDKREVGSSNLPRPTTSGIRPHVGL